MPIPINIRHIDRTIEWLIEKELTKEGYYPDKDAFNPDDYPNPNDEWNSLLDSFRSQGKLIEVYGVGNYKDRGELVDTKIIIDRDSDRPSPDVNPVNSGFYFEPYDEIVDGETKTFYRKYRMEDTTYEIDYSIRYITEDVDKDRKITTIFANLFKKRNYITTVVDDDRNLIEGAEFWLMRESGSVDVSGTDFMERVFSYTVKDVSIEDLELLEERIAAIDTVNVTLLPKRLTDDLNDDTTESVDSTTEF